MSDSDRAFIGKMGAALHQQGETLHTQGEILQKHGQAVDLIIKHFSTFGPRPISPLATGIEQTIEHNTREQKFRMQVTFESGETMTFDERKLKAEHFLVDMEDLMREYDVKTLNGTYAKDTF